MKNQLLKCTLILFSMLLFSTTKAQRIEVDGIPGEHGIHVNNPGLSGLRIFSPGEMGVYVDFAPHHGFFSYGAGNSGFHTYASQDDGAQLYNSVDDGLHIKKSGGQGIEIDSGSLGMLIHHQTHGAQISDCAADGIQIINTGDDGIFIDNVADDGLYINNAGDRGIVISYPGTHAVRADGGATGLYATNQTGDGIRIASSGNDGINISGFGGHGVEIVGGPTGLYTRDQSAYGVYADQSAREAGWFRNIPTSVYPSLRTTHGNDSRYDLFLGGHGIAGSDGRMTINLDNNNNATNDYFEVVRSAAQGGDYSFWVGESGDAWIRDDFHVTGNLSKGGGSFMIDHPLDPENKYLYHSFVESPDMMNVYNGNIILDANGEATISMEDWFDALNRDFRYQLTSIGAPGPNLFVAQKMEGNSFRIAGGQAGAEVSWQVTGIREDPYANQNRIQTEVEKEDYNKGKYVHPEVYESIGRGSNLKQIIPIADYGQPAVEPEFEANLKADLERLELEELKDQEANERQMTEDNK